MVTGQTSFFSLYFSELCSSTKKSLDHRLAEEALLKQAKRISVVASVEGPSAYARLANKTAKAETHAAAKRLLNNTVIHAVSSNKRRQESSKEACHNSKRRKQHGSEHRQ